MRIQCEFCNTTYESKEHSMCPNCGAATGDNKIVQEQLKRDQETRKRLEEHKLEQERLNTEQEKLQSERLRNQMEAERTHQAINKGIGISKVIMLCVVVFFVLIGVVSCSITTLKEEGFFEKYEQEFQQSLEEEEPEIQEEHKTVNINEPASIFKYTITCDKFEVVDPYPWKPDAGTEYIDAHFIIENLTDDTLHFEDAIVCVADGFECKKPLAPNSIKSELRNLNISKGLKTQGSKCFQVPIDAKEVLIKVGDYITIKIR